MPLTIQDADIMASCTHWHIGPDKLCSRCKKDPVAELKGWWRQRSGGNYHLPSKLRHNGQLVSLCGMAHLIKPIDIESYKLAPLKSWSVAEKKYTPNGSFRLNGNRCTNCMWVEKLFKNENLIYR